MRKFLSNSVLTLGILLSIIVFASLAKYRYWGFDLLTHFYLQYAVLLLLAVVFIVLVAKARAKALALWLLPALGVVLFNLFPFLPTASNSVTQTSESTNSIKALTLNLYYGNPHALSIANYLKQEDADLILLTEIIPETMQVLKNELGSVYPHIHDSSRRGAFGIALLSKHPLDIAQTFNLRSSSSRRSGQSIYAVVNASNTSLHIVGMHPLPPTAERYAESRDYELAGLQSFVKGLLNNDADSPILLLGDFNASPWSHPLESLFREAPIKHGSIGHGIWPTWRMYGRGPIVLGAPIDHILISENIDTLSYKTKQVEGSDHSAIIGEFILP